VLFTPTSCDESSYKFSRQNGNLRINLITQRISIESPYRQMSLVSISATKPHSTLWTNSSVTSAIYAHHTARILTSLRKLVASSCLNQSVSDAGQHNYTIVYSTVILAGILPSDYALLSFLPSDTFIRDVMCEKETNNCY